MQVIKRNGKIERLNFDKIYQRISNLMWDLDTNYISTYEISQKVIEGLIDNMKTSDIDELIGQTAAAFATYHPDYTKLAGRVIISNLHKETSDSFYMSFKKLFDTGQIRQEVFDFVKLHRKEIEVSIDSERDYKFDYFGIKTLQKSYLLRNKIKERFRYVKGEIIERPQYLWMRVALEIHFGDIDKVIECYNDLSEFKYIHATPTLFNSSTPLNQLASCFLIDHVDDSIEGMSETITDISKISKLAGGIGLNISNVRAKGSYINGTGGESNGLVPYMVRLNALARHINQGGKRKGAFAVFIEPWHADIQDFLNLKLNHGKEEMRARDLFYGLWIPDLFMTRVKEDKNWSLFCPHEAPGLNDVYGKEFDDLYTLYENDNRARKTVKARAIWSQILSTQTETGTPYILYKDSVNTKSNQKHYGPILQSNLCTEILEVSNKNETAVCNLASVNLLSCVKSGEFDFTELGEITQKLVHNLDNVIDTSNKPTNLSEKSDNLHRAIGIGVQGLADVFAKLKMSWISESAKQLNKDIFECIYYNALVKSVELAKERGKYDTFDGSPTSYGILQFDMWEINPSDKYDWATLRKDIMEHGLRNSLLVAPAPTASRAQIQGVNECFEPFTSNLYSRRTLSGEYVLINKYLVNDLIKLDLWNDEIREELIAANGSVQMLDIPDFLKERYLTVYELSQKVIIDMAADRGAFICQSQSMNLFVESPTASKLNSMHFYAWSKGLKTGMYYLRSKAAVDPVKFTISTEKAKQKVKNLSLDINIDTSNICSIDDPDCESCAG